MPAKSGKNKKGDSKAIPANAAEQTSRQQPEGEEIRTAVKSTERNTTQDAGKNEEEGVIKHAVVVRGEVQKAGGSVGDAVDFQISEQIPEAESTPSAAAISSMLSCTWGGFEPQKEEEEEEEKEEEKEKKKEKGEEAGQDEEQEQGGETLEQGEGLRKRFPEKVSYLTTTDTCAAHCRVVID